MQDTIFVTDKLVFGGTDQNHLLLVNLKNKVSEQDMLLFALLPKPYFR